MADKWVRVPVELVTNLLTEIERRGMVSILGETDIIWHAAELQKAIATAPRNDDELARLEREIAEDAAREVVESEGVPCVGGWFNVSNAYDLAYDKELRILELLCLLERHPDHPEWVRVKETE